MNINDDRVDKFVDAAAACTSRLPSGGTTRKQYLQLAVPLLFSKVLRDDSLSYYK
jgi:hypothetical protein